MLVLINKTLFNCVSAITFIIVSYPSFIAAMELKRPEPYRPKQLNFIQATQNNLVTGTITTTTSTSTQYSTHTPKLTPDSDFLQYAQHKVNSYTIRFNALLIEINTPCVASKQKCSYLKLLDQLITDATTLKFENQQFLDELNSYDLTPNPAQQDLTITMLLTITQLQNTFNDVLQWLINLIKKEFAIELLTKKFYSTSPKNDRL